MPYVIFPENKLKILLDTGSTKSFVNPDIAKKYFKKSINKDPFQISTAHGTSTEYYSTVIPCSKMFKKSKDFPLKFHLFNFHKRFDCLLGLDNLKLLDAKIDLVKNELVTPNVSIKIHYLSSTPEVNNIEIEARSEQVAKINIKNIKDGDVIIPYTKFSKLEIPQCVAKVKNFQAVCTIINPTESDVTVNMNDKSFHVEKFENYEQRQPESNLNFFNTEKIKFDISKIRTDHMNSEEKQEISKLIKEYADIFHLDDKPLTFTSKVKHKIRTKDELPVYTKSYRYPEIHRAEVHRQIEKMLKQNIIRPSHSPWSSPIWVVPKKLDASGQQKWRIVVDYRKLNEKTIGDRYPLPHINDLLDKLGRCQYFSTIDLASGFHQIEMDENDIEKTAFNTENGHYEYLRMPFGLRNAPATFQRVMEHILRGILNEKCLVYLDDIIIFSTSLQEHIQNLKAVFERLRQAKFKIQLDKSEFLRKEVAYLGHIVTPEGVKPNPDKIKAIQNYPIPKTPKQLKGFLGLLGYYRKFIKDFAKITKPLTKCLKKDSVIDINNPEYFNCFELCKKLLINEPLLQYPDFSKTFNITTDASGFAIAGVLSQGKIGSDLPIAYASRTLNSSETNYSTIEKELLAVIYAVKYFRPYIFGRKFNIITDHKPLEWLFSLNEPNSKLMRWRLKLEEYDYDVIYKKGKLNKNADALSRIQLNMNETIDRNDGIFKFMKDFNKTFEKPGTSKNNIDNESLIVELDSEDENLDDETDDQTVHSNENNPVVGIPIVECPVNYGMNQIFVSEINFDPPVPTVKKLFGNKQRILFKISKNNFEHDVINFIKEYIVPKVKYHIYFEDSLYEKFSLVIQKYFKNTQLNFVKCTEKLIDVESEQEILEVIQNYHESKTNHRGLDETENKIKTRYYWPNQRRSIQTFINNCELCQITKYDRTPLKLKLNITPTATKPFEILHVDSITLEHIKFLTIIDSFSKYAQAYKLNSAQGIEVANNLIKYFTHHGIPKQIISDNGGEFKNSIIKELLQVHKVEIHFISSQHPESNGQIERFHSTLIEHVRLLNNQKEYSKDSIETKVNYALLAYNNSLHSVTKLTPAEIISGHLNVESPFNINLDQQLVNNYIENHKNKTRLLYNKINEALIKNKESTINKANENRHEPPEIPKQVYVKNRQKQSKTKNRYKPEQIKSINPDLKTAVINRTHGNTAENIHLSNIKHPRKKTYKFQNFPGPSASREEQK